MKDSVAVNKIDIIGCQIKVQYSVSRSIEKYFRTNEFFAEYSINVENVPFSIAVIPFICNILPFIWIKNCDLIVPMLDKTFYNQLDILRNSYQQMYPMLNFRGNIKVEQIEDISYETQKSMCFFSGGVDAFSTLLNHIIEKPILFTIWGADISFSDEQSWNIIKKQNEQTAKQFSLDFLFCKTNFRDFYNNDLFNSLVSASNDDWWHGFQHGMGLIGHAAPLCLIKGISTLYIASSYAVENNRIASHPTIDNNVVWAGVHTVHDQYMYPRQSKIHDICRYARKNKKFPYLRVCWQSHSSSNCGYCEKCMRTIYGLIVEGEDPNFYGFSINPYLLKDNILKFIQAYRFSVQNVSYWIMIQDRYKHNKNKIKKEYSESIQWMDTFDFKIINTRKYYLLRRMYQLPYLITHFRYFAQLLRNRYRH